ncbi:sensor histidine kinase [Flavobacterium undicola]|uniref:sensor histidine kinase n=1 Tax=Flavobacterium undicola TaxID=1932779 RepID=UPI001F44455D|nr:ATP-binding protein [Flavobacterium undicola]
MSDYKLNRIITSLPHHFSDEAGLLLFNIHDSILESEKFITEKKDLIYLLSHDLKTFTSNPQSLAKMILDANPSDEVKELAKLIYDSSAEQFRYIENFRRMLKEQDEMLNANLEFKIIALDEIVESIENQVNQAVISKKIKLIKNIETTTVHLKIDQELLTRVIFNLVYNAIKFSLADSEIYLKVYSDKEKTYIDVIDQGIGFEQHDNEKMFAKFTKMSRLGTNSEGSTGIAVFKQTNHRKT